MQLEMVDIQVAAVASGPDVVRTAQGHVSPTSEGREGLDYLVALAVSCRTLVGGGLLAICEAVPCCTLNI